MIFVSQVAIPIQQTAIAHRFINVRSGTSLTELTLGFHRAGQLHVDHQPQVRAPSASASNVHPGINSGHLSLYHL